MKQIYQTFHECSEAENVFFVQVVKKIIKPAFLFRDASSYVSLDSSTVSSFDDNWIETIDTIMTSYKTVSVQCKITGLQSRLESIILNYYKV